MKKFLPLCLFLASSTFAKPLSLNEAAKYALDHSPSLAQEYQRDRISELDLTTRARAFYPSLDLESSHGVGQSRPKTATEPWISSAQLKLTEKLYDNGESWTRYTQGKNQREAQRLLYEKTRDLLILEVTKNYYEISLTLKTLDARQTQKKLLEQQLESSSRLYKQGLKTKADHLRFIGQAQLATIDERAAQNAVAKARLELLRTLGVPPTEAGTLEFELIAPDSLKLETTLDVPNVEKTYEYRIAKFGLESQKSESDLARRSYWPQLSVSTGAYYQNNSYLNSGAAFSTNQNYGWNLLLNLNYNIWDWGTKSREVEKSDAQVLVYENELKRSTNDVYSNIQQLLLDIKDYKSNLLINEELLKAQEEAYNTIKRDYSEGRAGYQDLMASLKDLLSAQVEYFKARYGFATLIARNKYYQGTLYGSFAK